MAEARWKAPAYAALGNIVSAFCAMAVARTNRHRKGALHRVAVTPSFAFFFHKASVLERYDTLVIPVEFSVAF